MADLANLGDDIRKEMPPQMRVQMKDFPKEKMDQLVPFEKGTTWYNNDYYGPYGVLGAIFTHFLKSPFSYPPKEKLGKTTDELIKESEEVIVLHLKEYDELL